MTKRKTNIILCLLCLNLLTTAFLAVRLFRPEDAGAIDFADSEQYVLYIGTNDKDTYEQIIPTDKAREIVNTICVKYVDGYTVADAEGGWVDEAGVLTQENTLVYTFTGVGEEQIIPLMDEVLAALNQSSILVERRGVSSAFYEGSDAA